MWVREYYCNKYSLQFSVVTVGKFTLHACMFVSGMAELYSLYPMMTMYSQPWTEQGRSGLPLKNMFLVAWPLSEHPLLIRVHVCVHVVKLRLQFACRQSLVCHKNFDIAAACDSWYIRSTRLLYKPLCSHEEGAAQYSNNLNSLKSHTQARDLEMQNGRTVIYPASIALHYWAANRWLRQQWPPLGRFACMFKHPKHSI